MVDSHSHIYLPEFEDDRDEILERAEKEGITKILLPAIDSASHKDMLRLENEHAEACKCMMGLHPCSVKEDHKQELQVARKWLEKRSFVAVGEIGLDFYWDKTFVAEQVEAFE